MYGMPGSDPDPRIWAKKADLDKAFSSVRVLERRLADVEPSVRSAQTEDDGVLDIGDPSKDVFLDTDVKASELTELKAVSHGKIVRVSPDLVSDADGGGLKFSFGSLTSEFAGIDENLGAGDAVWIYLNGEKAGCMAEVAAV